jgi:hypothetical protein
VEAHLDDVDRKSVNIIALGRFNVFGGKTDAFDFRDSLDGLFLFSITGLRCQARDQLSSFGTF